MAKRGTTKRASRDHEDFIARQYGGTVSPSSGAAVTDGGDVRTDTHLFECKQTGNHDKPAKSISVNMDVLAKIVDEAWEEGKEPVIALRVYNPDHILADRDGNVDLIVRPINDDLQREQ